MTTLLDSRRSTGLVELARLLRRTFDLTCELTRREITDRYAGQLLGSLWAIGHPLLLMAVYAFVFTVVLKLKIGGTVEMPLNYTIYLLSGLIPWMAIQESMAKSASVLPANANLVKQVVFPIEVLPIKGLLASMVTQAIASVLLMAYTLVTSGSLPWTWVLVPVLFGIQFLTMVGVCLFLSSIAAYFRDVKDVVQLLCTAGMYFLPVFYLPEWVPEFVRPLLWCNPFTYLAWCYQDACYFGQIEHPLAWGVASVGAVMSCAVGYRVFARLKPCFGSVL